MPQTLQLAHWAKERVLKNKKLGSEYKSLVKGIGAMIIQNGLLGTMVFLQSKAGGKENHYAAVLEDFFMFLEMKGMKEPRSMEFEDDSYIRLTKQSLEMVKWLRRYVGIFLAGKEDE